MLALMMTQHTATHGLSLSPVAPSHAPRSTGEPPLLIDDSHIHGQGS
jgi:hypothetical protein